MKSMCTPFEVVERKKFLSKIETIVSVFLILLISFFFIRQLSYELSDRPVAYVPVGQSNVVAIEILKKDKYILLTPGMSGFNQAKQEAIEIPVSPDYYPGKK